MTWKIVNQNTQQHFEFEDHKILSIGSAENCEIRIPKSKSRSIHSQLILDDGFIFHINENHVTPYFLNYNLQLDDTLFKINYTKTYKFNEKFLDENLYEIFSSDSFSALLSTVQKSFFESQGLNLEFPTISIDAIIHHSIQVLAAQALDASAVFDANIRLKFKKIIWCVWAQIFEYGILTQPILTPTISEIMVNGHNKIYYEERGQIVPAKIQFSNENELIALIERMCTSVGRRIDESIPYCDARLKEGHRIHAIIPPLSLIGPCLTIRKFPNFAYTLEKLIEQESLSQECADILKHAVVNKKNIVISGGTGTGKTTLLNCLSAFIPNTERVITIEDSAELKLQQTHVIRLESRKENIEHQGKVTMRDLVKNALRMRPDRIIVGECRDAETLDMLQAMNTGHDGSMTTIHANSPQDALRRIETLVLFSEIDLPSRAIREQLSSAVHLIVQLERQSSGTRHIASVANVIGFNEQTTTIITESIYAHSKKSHLSCRN